MMKWLFRWWWKGVREAGDEDNQTKMAAHMAAMVTHFATDGMTFQIIKAENGRILKVQIPDSSSNSHTARSFNPPNTNEKLYVIPEGEDVMAFVTRAIVEERIK